MHGNHLLLVTTSSDLSALPLEGDELVTVLSNLLDNALEACRKIRSDGNTHRA